MKKFLLPVLAIALGLLTLWLVPHYWYPRPVQLWLYNWFGASSYVAPPKTARLPPSPPGIAEEEECPPDREGWRKAQVIEGVQIDQSLTCVVDNPYLIAAVVKGTNNVSADTLMRSGLAPDAVIKGRDLDGDGDPDEIEIHLEATELNGDSPDLPIPVPGYSIAPGVQPGFWVFAPKTVGMSTENIISMKANPLLRLPSPAIRVEVGDRVKIVLENTHYLPHTIHFHGVDHPYHPLAHGFVDKDVGVLGKPGGDGVPESSELPAMPGHSQIYYLNPRQPGTFFYHCHVQPQVHMMMGLQGLFIVEPNRPHDDLQTLNVGDGQVRHPSVAVREKYAAEYDLHYEDADKELHKLIQQHNDPRLIVEAQQQYNITQSQPNYYLLNGRSFPYTFQESLITVKPNEKVKLRVLNGGQEEIYLHTHGHKVMITHYDGVEANPAAQLLKDVVPIGPAERVDLELNTTNDGLHSYGPGIWMMHDHREAGFTTDGIHPGGDVSAIAYEGYLRQDGFPKTSGMQWKKFFSPDYYVRKTPIWEDYDPDGMLGKIVGTGYLIPRYLTLGLSLGAFLAVLLVFWRTRRQAL